MKVVAVFLVEDGRRGSAPVVLFPANHFADLQEGVKRYVDAFHPGRLYEVEELDVSLRELPSS